LLKLENIFTKENLLYSFENISKRSKGLDKLSYIEFQKDLGELPPPKRWRLPN
jgi:hypothetical protein